MLADWQEVWHSPQPPFLADSQRLRELKVLILFIPIPRFIFFYIFYIIFFTINKRKNDISYDWIDLY